MAKKPDGIWEKKPAAEDYVAAHDYLTLLFSEADARKLVQRLRRAPTIQRQGKDCCAPAKLICSTKTTRTSPTTSRRLRRARSSHLHFWCVATEDMP